MASYDAHVTWTRDPDVGVSPRYKRAHEWRFDGGAVIPASPSPHIVPEPYSNPELVDPEEAFVASLSSCHMLFFLHLAQEAGFPVASYEDRAVGTMAAIESGEQAMTHVRLSPVVTYVGDAPDAEVEAELHDAAHRKCFIANSVKTQIEISLLAR